jgi:hypothetical protein
MVGKRGRAMSITDELAKILALVDRPGDFYAVGRTELPENRGRGRWADCSALLAAQAKRLIKVATRAPYGHGAETVVEAVTSPCSAYGKVARRSTAAAIAAAIADPGTMQMRAMMTTNSR